MTTERARQLAAEVLTVITRHQRRLRDDTACQVGRREPCPKCVGVHSMQVAQFIENNEPIQFVLPAFPCKSPNYIRKVLGDVPDMAERLSLSFLNRLCQDIEKIYRPGAQVTICADGHVFIGTIATDDATVIQYQRELRRFVGELENSHIRLFNLNDHYVGDSFDVMRSKLQAEYAETLDEIREATEHDKYLDGLRKSFISVLAQDSHMPADPKTGRPAWDGCRTRAHLQQRSRARSWELLRRSRAWGFLVGDVFPGAVRLSIHPQPCGSQKLGINLLDESEGNGAKDNWLTPWHSTAVEVNGHFTLMRRLQAEELGAQLVYVDGKPSHFVLPRSPVELNEVSELAGAGRK